MNSFHDSEFIKQIFYSATHLEFSTAHNKYHQREKNLQKQKDLSKQDKVSS